MQQKNVSDVKVGGAWCSENQLTNCKDLDGDDGEAGQKLTKSRLDRDCRYYRKGRNRDCNQLARFLRPGK